MRAWLDSAPTPGYFLISQSSSLDQRPLVSLVMNFKMVGDDPKQESLTPSGRPRALFCRSSLSGRCHGPGERSPGEQLSSPTPSDGHPLALSMFPRGRVQEDFPGAGGPSQVWHPWPPCVTAFPELLPGPVVREGYQCALFLAYSYLMCSESLLALVLASQTVSWNLRCTICIWL